MIDRIKEEFKQGKHFLVFSGFKILGQALFAVLPLAIAFFLSPEGFGSYSLAIMIIYFLTALLIGSSSQPFVVYASEELKEHQKVNKTFSVRMLLLFYSTIIFVVLMIISWQWIGSFASLTNNQVLFMIAAYFGVGLRYFFESFFLGINKRMHHATYQVLTAGIMIIGLLILYFYFTITLENVFILLFIGPVLAFLSMIGSVNFKQVFPLELDKKLLAKYFHYTKWVVFGGIGVYLINWGDNVILRLFVSLDEIGVYNLGYQIFKGLNMLIFTISMYFLPFISQNIKNKKKIKDYLYKKRPKILVVGIGGLGILYFLIPFIITFLYGKEYAASIGIAQVLVIAAFFALYKDFYSPIIHSLKRYKFSNKAVIFAAFLNLFLDYLFVPLWGIMGAAIATTTTYIVGAMITLYYFQTYCKSEIS